jgi:hypothetical protein
MLRFERKAVDFSGEELQAGLRRFDGQPAPRDVVKGFGDDA